MNPNKVTYINRLESGKRETVDQVNQSDFPNDYPAMRLEVNSLIDNYSRADNTAYYYESSRACSNWRD